MMRLLVGLGCEVEITTRPAIHTKLESSEIEQRSVEDVTAEPAKQAVDELAQKFTYLNSEEIAATPTSSKFQPLTHRFEKDAA
jgi:hypothetical protein